VWGSATVYSGAILAVAGLALAVKPSRRLWVPTRGRALVVSLVGILVVAIGLALPARESRVDRVETRLDEFAPAWQFREVHTIRIAAPPARVFEAITRLRADEIFLFRTLTWIRRGGRQSPQSILNAGDTAPIIDVAKSSGFVRLAIDAPRELVIGTVVIAPPGTRGTLTPRVFQKPLPPGFALATMNFLVSPDGPHDSLVSTETRVFANDAASRRLCAAYWRVIYPGSAMIRRMWLRAIARRALGG
jgi:hypothetical protein